MTKRTVRKSIVKKSKKKKSILRKSMPFFIGTVAIILVFAAGYHYRNGLAYYLGFKSDKISKTSAEKQRLSDVRNYTLLSKYDNLPVGIDVSEYQGTILWDSVLSPCDLFLFALRWENFVPIKNSRKIGRL